MKLNFKQVILGASACASLWWYESDNLAQVGAFVSEWFIRGLLVLACLLVFVWILAVSRKRSYEMKMQEEFERTQARKRTSTQGQAPTYAQAPIMMVPPGWGQAPTQAPKQVVFKELPVERFELL